MTPVRPPATQVERWRIRVYGVVQGVGYRPFVYKLAHELGISGWVRNDPEGVLIEAAGPAEALTGFISDLNARAPGLARVHGVHVTDARPACAEYPGAFTIVESGHSGARTALVPADTHVCADCQAELFDPNDRRFRYPFINCTNCGPRYSLVNDLPYDRAQTTMAHFIMCGQCEREYRDPLDRRYHAQPNACPDCGPRLLFTDRSSAGVLAEGEDALRRCTEALQAAQIAAVKSVGGFHLAVNATDPEAVARLRKRKRRDSKPFAVMVRDLATARRLTLLSDEEATVLASPARPILLARKRPGALPESVAPRNPNLGLMLPSAPHHHLLLDADGLDSLVMTSGNISGYPIAFRNEDAIAQLFEVADVMLYHDRDITIRVDDSVVRLSTHPGLREPLLAFLRRSRGYAPYPVDVGQQLAPIVAYGAELKTTVALSSGSKVYLSQHVGDLKNDETFASHRVTAQHLAKLYRVSPAIGAYDLHPQFRSVAAAGTTATLESGPRLQVQHHHAHMASCMAENLLTGTTIGVVFDGVGYGSDGTAWGGEFLLGDYAQVTRAAHLRSMPLLGGDQAVREPLRTGFVLARDALAGAAEAVAAFPVLRTLSDEQVHVYDVMAGRGINSPVTSSMGRLFDGVAALLGICLRAEYEAQGPIEMEGLLNRDLTLEDDPRYAFANDSSGPVAVIDPRPIMRAVAADLAAGVAPARISRRFHSAVVSMILKCCRELRAATGTGQVVLSGGVFLNEFVVVNSLTALAGAGFDAHCHRQVPTNDGGIALGQVMVANARQMSGASETEGKQ